MKQWLDSVTEAMPELVIRTEEPMSKHTTFRIGGAAEVFAAPDARELPQLLAMAKGADVPVTVIGNGSNLLVEEARKRGVTAISLDATAMGMPLYESMGFVHMPMEMELPNTI